MADEIWSNAFSSVTDGEFDGCFVNIQSNSDTATLVSKLDCVVLSHH